MLALLDQTKEPWIPSEAEAAIAKAAAEKLQKVAAAEKDIKIALIEEPNLIVPLPAKAVQLLFGMLEAMSHRVPFSVIPHDACLTSQQAADYLNVSRPYLVNLIDKGELEHKMVGRHRRIRFGDLLEYERKTREARRAAIAKVASETQRLGLE
jgi:excisionase family DNA binding protein